MNLLATYELRLVYKESSFRLIARLAFGKSTPLAYPLLRESLTILVGDIT